MALSTTHNVNLSDGGGRTLDERKLDGMDIDAESFYYSYKLISKAVESANSFERQLDSKSIDSDVIKQLGCDFSVVKKYEKDALKDLKDLWTRMMDTKRLLSISSTSNSTIFNGIDAQYKLQELMEFGDLEDEATQKKYWECLVDIYHGAKAKYVNGDISSPLALTASDIAGYSGLNEIEKYVVQQMQETGYDIYDMYLDYSKMQTQRDKYQAEIHDYEWDLYDAQVVNGPYYSPERAKYYEGKIWELAALDWALQEKMEAMEPTLKAAGYVEYTGWEQIGNAFKKMNEDWKTAWDCLWDGDFSEAWSAAGTAFKSTKSTFCVINEKIIAGGLKVGEYVTDGLILIGGGVASLLCADEETSKDIWEGTMAVVAEDVVGDLEEGFYEHTTLGKTINDNSYLKYDSEGAEMFKKAGVKGAEVAGAVVVGACTCGVGGLALAGGIGFMEGLGEGGERQFNITDEDGNYIRRNMTGVALAGLNGVGKATEWVGYAKTGRGLAGAFNGQTASQKEMGKLATKLDTALADSPKVLRVAAKTAVSGDTAVGMAGAGARYVSTGIETGDWKEGLGELGLNAALIYGGNFITQWKLDGTMKPYSGKDAIMKADDVPSMPEVPSGDDLPAGVSINEYGEIVRINPLDEIDDQIAAATALGDYDTVRALQQQKSALFQEEMASVFGAENVEQVSGISIEGANGRFIDPNAAADNINLMKTKAYDICLKEGLIAENENCTRDLFANWSEVYFNPQEYNSTTHQFIWPGGEGAAQYTRDNLVAKARELGIKDVDKLTDDEILLTIGRDYGFDELEKMGANSVPISSLDGKSFDRINDTVGVGNDKYGEFFGNTEDSIESRALKPKTAEAGVRHRYALSGTPTSDTFDAEFVYGQPKTEITLGENGDYQIICSQTTARPWFAQPGGAEQYTFYLADSSGKILTKVAYDGSTQLYKLSVTDLKNLGIILGETIQ